MNAPANPAGDFVPERGYGLSRRDELIAEIDQAPTAARNAIAGLSDAQLETRYRNWSIRQIVHHVADSHVNSYIRFKLALTEECPTIKPYDEARWAALPDSNMGELQAPLALLDGLHCRWVQLLRTISQEQLSLSFIHPEFGRTISLSEALCYYVWHGKHHTAQIMWLRGQYGW